MYGWRGRIGLILPVDNAVMEPEIYGLRIPGVSFHAVRLRTGDRDRMPDDAVELAPVLNKIAANAVVYACAATSFLKGVDANDLIVRKLEEACGVPAITATGAMLSALQASGATKIAVGTPYAAFRGNALVEFLEKKGFEVVNVVHNEMDLFTTNLQYPDVSYRLGRDANVEDADAVLLSGTNFRTFEIIETLEKDIGKPVITSNQAIIWSLQKSMNFDIRLDGLGRLLDPGARNGDF